MCSNCVFNNNGKCKVMYMDVVRIQSMGKVCYARKERTE